jgi:hypothetical protein
MTSRTIIVYQESGSSLCFNLIHPEFTEFRLIVAKWIIKLKK